MSCATCTMAAMHQYMTVAVQVTCHQECSNRWMFQEQTGWEVKRVVGKPYTSQRVDLVCLVCLVERN